jgi:hypothetical protein
MSPPENDDDLPSIDPTALDEVTGGAGASNDDVTAAVQALSSSLSDFISSRKSNNADVFTQMLPFILMMSGGGGGFSGGFSCGSGCCQRCGCRPCRCRY